MGMSNDTVKKLEAERQILLEELATLRDMLHGSLVERYTICSRPQCKCHSGQRHGPVRCLVVNRNGKQRQKYIPNGKLTDAKAGLEQYARLQIIVDRVTDINLQLFKENKDV
jgi:hypothetical protein